ncbi:MAG: response regulator transcription factor [Halanaerobiaceae bacterium]|nr:response regulator transcription factor [Halanaerobiaceae bacterium]
MANNYDVIILESILPDMDGIELITYIREKGNITPILLLTSKNKISDKINALNKGADDYLTKPYNPEELLARLRALWRRSSYFTLKDEIITLSNITLNKSRIELCSQNRKEHLTPKEFELINIFLNNPYHVLTKDTIISKIWPFDIDVCYNTLEAHISSLRKKLKRINSKPRIITVRGIGYKMEA